MLQGTHPLATANGTDLQVRTSSAIHTGPLRFTNAILCLCRLQSTFPTMSPSIRMLLGRPLKPWSSRATARVSSRVRKLVDCCAHTRTRINGDAALVGYCYNGRRVFCVLYYQTSTPC